MIEFERSRSWGGANYFVLVISKSFFVNVHGIGEVEASVFNL